MITKQSIDEILLAAKIEEVVGDFVSLKKRGQNWVGVCPFHDDKNPSMYVSPRLGIFKCFVCDAGGNAVHFLMEHEKISYPEALRFLAKKYNITIEEERERTPEEKLAQDERDSMFILNGFAEKYFADQLFNGEEGRTIGLSYFKERGFNEATIQKFKLGYNPDSWDAFTQEALKQGYSMDLLLKTGLTKKPESGKFFDFFKGRIIFPIHNSMGKVVGFGGRILKKGDKTAKYFNSPESEIYHKSDVLYGFFFARKAIRAKDNAILVEGYTDVISLFQAGIENVVASSGTALTDRQIKLIAAQTQNITVLYDGDTAGIKASMRGIDMLLKAGMNVKVVMLPEGEDPDSFARKHQSSELTEFIEQNATDFLLFKVKIMTIEAGNDPMKKAAMVNEIVETIAEVKDQIARSFYIKECAEIFKISEEVLNGQLRKIVWKKINQERGKATEQATELLQVPASAIPESQQKMLQKENLLEQMEQNIILLLLKFGMYEIDVEMKNEEEKICYEKTRIDQYLFDDFFAEGITFSKPLFQHIYNEYAAIAPIVNEQDEIRRFFSNHTDDAIREYVVKSLLQSEPNYSPEWENRYDKTTNTLLNSLNKLNIEVENSVNRFKLRLLERQYEKLLEELKENHPQEVMDGIALKLTIILEKRKQIADLLGIVVTQ